MFIVDHCRCAIHFVSCSSLIDSQCRKPDAKGLDLFLANIIPDSVKNVMYILIEILTIGIRIAIYVSTRRLLSDTVIVRNTPGAIKKKQKQRTVSFFSQNLFTTTS
jgi:hypothetical protein